MQQLGLVGYTADLSHLVLVDQSTGERFKARVDADLVRTLAEVLAKDDDPTHRELLADVLGQTAGASTAPAWWREDDGLDGRPSTAAAALLALGSAAAGTAPRDKVDGAQSRLTPSEIQRMLRAGKAPETVAEQAGVSLDWVMRWYRPIAAEQRKVIASVRGGRQERDGFGKSDDLIGDAVRINLMSRGVEPDEEEIAWIAARPEGRPYWTVILRFPEGERIRKATWRYDLGTGRVTPRDDLAIDLGWTAPITHPHPGRMHIAAGEEPPAPPVPRAAPTPPPPGPKVRWAPPTPPRRRTVR